MAKEELVDGGVSSTNGDGRLKSMAKEELVDGGVSLSNEDCCRSASRQALRLRPRSGLRSNMVGLSRRRD